MSVDQKSPSGNAIPPAERILVDTKAVAGLLNVTEPVVRRWVDAGLFTPVVLPLGVRRTLYRLEDVRAAIDSLPLLSAE